MFTVQAPGTNGWTIAWRKRRANRFARVTDWTGTWREARELANKIVAAHPELQVYYVASAAMDAWEEGRVQAGELPADRLEDRGFLVLESLKKIKMIDQGSIHDLIDPDPKPTPSITAQVDPFALIASGTPAKDKLQHNCNDLVVEVGLATSCNYGCKTVQCQVCDRKWDSHQAIFWCDKAS